MLNLPIKILDKIVSVADDEQITFSNIDTLVAQWDAMAKVTSRHLVLFINARSIDVSDSITNFLRFNGSAADYYYQRLSGVDNVDSAGRVDGANAINLPPICGANNVGTYGGSMVLIPHAFNTTNHKTLLALGGASEFAVEAVAARWAQAAAITSVTLLEGVGDDYVVGSEFLMGVVDERYLVEEIEDAAADFSPTFDNIPQGEGDLAVVAFARSDRAATWDDITHAINGDEVAGNYNRQRLDGVGAVVSASSIGDRIIGIVPGDNATALVFGALVAVYSQYTNQNLPSVIVNSGLHESAGPTGHLRLLSGRRNNVEPINKLALSPNAGTDCKAGSLFSLYRIPKRLIDRQVLTEDTATVTFANIPQHFEALTLHVYARTDVAALHDGVTLVLNGDGVAANYDYQSLYGEAAAVGAIRDPALNYLMGIIGNTQGVGEYGGGVALFPAYYRADGHKHIIAIEGRTDNRALIRSSRWENNNPITSIVLTPQTGPSFLPGSVFELEGVLRKEGLPASAGMRWG